MDANCAGTITNNANANVNRNDTNGTRKSTPPPVLTRYARHQRHWYRNDTNDSKQHQNTEATHIESEAGSTHPGSPHREGGTRRRPGDISKTPRAFFETTRTIRKNERHHLSWNDTNDTKRVHATSAGTTRTIQRERYTTGRSATGLPTDRERDRLEPTDLDAPKARGANRPIRARGRGRAEAEPDDGAELAAERDRQHATGRAVFRRRRGRAVFGRRRAPQRDVRGAGADPASDRQRPQRRRAPGQGRGRGRSRSRGPAQRVHVERLQVLLIGQQRRQGL
mmetsp:Transcript_6403/g.11070  ORF Transcript_6403/g.11070 Transcript_6403/m.11070 type:complete len:281 (+) Transcript_6403:1008-1850(+)